MLALIVAIGGGAATLVVDQLWLRNWMNSGEGFPIGQRGSLQLPARPTIVYYESPVAAPVGDATLRIYDSEGERVRVKNLDGSLNYHLMLTGWSGRALWEINVPADGMYTIHCHNYNFLNDDEIPAEDRVVFLKQPESFAEVKTVRTFVVVTGATITMTAVIVLYAMHTLALRRRRRAEVVAAA